MTLRIKHSEHFDVYLFLLLRIFFASSSFALPITFAYWHSRGMSVERIGQLFGTFAVALVIAEPISGLVADLLGRRKSLMLAVLFLIMSCAITLVGKNYNYFLLAEILAALGVSMISGTDQAYLLEMLECRGHIHKYASYWAMSRVLDLIAGVLFSATGSFLVGRSLTLPWICAFSGWIAALVLLCFLPELVSTREKTSGSALMRTFSGLLSVRSILLVIIGGGLISISSLIEFLLQPAIKSSGIDVSWNGLIYAMSSVVTAFGVVLSPIILKAIHPRTLSSFVLLLTGIVAILFTILGSTMGILSYFPYFFLKGIGIVSFPTWLGGWVAPACRATLQSIINMSGRISVVIATPILASSLKIDTANAYSTLSSIVVFMVILAVLTSWIVSTAFKEKLQE